VQLESPDYWKSLINMSLSRFFILRTLHDEPTHGYALLGKLSEFTAGCCTPAYGTIYPVLKALLEGEYAQIDERVQDGRPRRVFELTPKGEAAYQVAVQTWREVLPYLEKALWESET
jgi:PadR family transcriptional regulator PadR